MQNVYPEFFKCLHTGISLLLHDIIFESGVSQGLVVKEMECSSFCSFLFNRTTTMVCSEAKENIMKSLPKLGLTNIEASDNAYLMLMNDFLASLDHWKVLSFFNMLFIYFTTSAKFVMNLLRKLTLPRNDWISFYFWADLFAILLPLYLDLF